MTLTESNTAPSRDRLNDRIIRQIQYTGPSAYVAGGDPIAAADLASLGMGDVYAVHGEIGNVGGAASSAVRILHFDRVNQKLQWFVPNTGAEAAGDLSGFSGILTFYGKG